MRKKIRLEGIYAHSKDVATRNIQGEFIIIPVTSGIGDSDFELYTLNDTAKEIWDKLDGKRSLDDILHELSSKFTATSLRIKKGIFATIEELLKRKLVIELKK